MQCGKGDDSIVNARRRAVVFKIGDLVPNVRQSFALRSLTIVGLRYVNPFLAQVKRVDFESLPGHLESQPAGAAA